jgi:dipeptidyl aminopeptidase/acylaminoacyl peptidase
MNRPLLFCAASLTVLCMAAPAKAADFTLAQVLHYPFVPETAAAQVGDRVAWIRELDGARNIWVSDAPGGPARQVTAATADDGQELTQLTFSPDGRTLLYARGGDHDENWPAAGDLQPNPASATEQPSVSIWLADLTGNAPPRKLAEGDAPAISSAGMIVFVRNHQIWTVQRDGTQPLRLFFDRGHDSAPTFSPDGKKLAFVSDRGDHAFIGIYQSTEKPILFAAPSTGSDGTPVWSPDSQRVAFVRQPAQLPTADLWPGSPLRPWSIMVADASTGDAKTAWRAPDTHRGAIMFTADALHYWAADDTLVFMATLEGWPHLYALPAAGGDARLLTPGRYMVEQTQLTPDRKTIVYTANTGPDANDGERRHLFKVGLQDGKPEELTSGAGIEANPAATAHQVAFVSSDARTPPHMMTLAAGAAAPKSLAGQDAPAAFPKAELLTPEPVTFPSTDGLLIHADLFRKPGEAARQPGVIFVHGGPVRQMLLGWHYMDYYANAYAVNQYLAKHGFVVLSVNYRLGVGYGQDFLEPAHAGPSGAAEYQDVVAAARFLQTQPGVDGARIGIWGGSYGGFLTAMALAKDSQIFGAGVDLHGVHDWRDDFDSDAGHKLKSLDPDTYDAALKLAYASSPIAYLDSWRSPVLLIQGDDDRNVHFSQTVDLAARLRTRPVSVEELVIPNEVHDFRRHASWAEADAATVEFLTRKLGR